MPKRSKQYIEALEKIEKKNEYDLREAIELSVKSSYVKFDETLDIAVNLGVDPRHSDQMVRGTVVLPNGLGKEIKVLVFAKGEKEKEALDAGADFIGDEETLAKIKDGWFYVNGEKFFIKGVGYSPCRPGISPGGHVDINLIEKDFKLIKEAGFNTVRTWGPMGKEWLDMAKKYNLMVIQGIWIDPNRDNYDDKAYINKSIYEVQRAVKYSRYYFCC